MFNKVKGSKYYFILTDKYGWDLTLDKVRDIKLKMVLQEEITEEILYTLYVRKKYDRLDMNTIFFDTTKKILTVKGLRIRCESLFVAESIIDTLVDYEVAPANLS